MALCAQTRAQSELRPHGPVRPVPWNMPSASHWIGRKLTSLLLLAETLASFDSLMVNFTERPEMRRFEPVVSEVFTGFWDSGQNPFFVAIFKESKKGTTHGAVSVRKMVQNWRFRNPGWPEMPDPGPE